MPDQNLCRCGAAPTAQRANPNSKTEPKCVPCAAIARHQLAAQPERTVPVPAHLVASGAALIHNSETVWNHQGKALDLAHDSKNIVVATPTASGKTLIFQLHTFHLIATHPDAKILAFYPAKALANDQLLRWRACAETAGLGPQAIQQITGDTPMRQREEMLARASICLMTPDIAHAWLIRTASIPIQREFLRKIRLIITDEAHVYEDVLGSNAAFMFRRLAAAAQAAHNPDPIQYIAATATIKNPEEHLQNLTGRAFVKVDNDDNGAPRHPTILYHLPPTNQDENLEQAAARLVLSIIDNDPLAQVILFHDSRQGAERIAAHAARPDSVAPYRAGYLPEDRRDIENRLRSNTVQALIATSALEVGIDMPDLNYGINLGLPPTRKQLHQRLGRVGRTSPATFIIFGPKDLFTKHSESLPLYYKNSVEGSRLHLDNQYIAYQHALCLKQENARSGHHSNSPALSWPPIFQDTLDIAHHAEPPRSLAHAKARSLHTPPQLAYSLRSSGEESLEIIPSLNGVDQNEIGNINSTMAIKEAFPGALYRHKGQTYTVKEWRRRQGRPYIRILQTSEPASASTQAVLRHVSVVGLNSATNTTGGTIPWTGGYASVNAEVWTSVEGFVSRRSGSNILLDYAEANDPSLSRKAILTPTTAFLLFLDAPWMSPGQADGDSNRADLAHLLSEDLAYQHSIAVQNLGTTITNILVETRANAPFLHENALLIYDIVHGGLGLTAPISRDLPATTARLSTAPSANAPAFHLLNEWVQKANTLFLTPPDPGPSGWWRTYPKGTPLQFTDYSDGITRVGPIINDQWDDCHLITIKLSNGAELTVPAPELTEYNPSANWVLWHPATGRYRPLANQ